MEKEEFAVCKKKKIGFGGQYGKNEPTFECFSQSEIDDKIARKLGIKEENIRWIDEEIG